MLYLEFIGKSLEVEHGEGGCSSLTGVAGPIVVGFSLVRSMMVDEFGVGFKGGIEVVVVASGRVEAIVGGTIGIGRIE